MSVVELFDSRGGTEGSGWSRTRRFKVELAGSAVHQDPLNDLGLPPHGTGFAQFPGLTVKSYSLIQRLNLRCFIVEVSYAPPAALTSTWGGLWQVSVSGSLESSRQFTTTLDQQQLDAGVLPTVIGPNYYVKKGTGEHVSSDKLFETTTRTVKDGAVQDEKIQLKRLDVRKKEGADITRAVASLTLKRVFAREVNFGRALSRLSMVNSDNFYGAVRGQLKFVTLNLVPTLIDAAENPTGVGSDVSLGFRWKTDKHQPTLVHMYESPDGGESVIRRVSDGKAVVEVFSGFLETSFNAMLSEL